MTAAFLAGLIVTLSAALAHAQGIPVTVDNFIRAESDMYMRNAVKDAGGTGKLHHNREPARIDNQSVIRLNRDTLYSMAVVDLDAGPVTVKLPETGKRFRSMQAINQDHYVVGDVVYRAGGYTIDRNRAGTRYVLLGVRTLVDPNDPNDVAQVHALQDATRISQRHPGIFKTPDWDAVSQKKVRDALLALNAATSGTFKRAFGSKGEVDPVHHLIGTAAGWGGNPDQDATYISVTPANNDGKTVYAVNVRDVPVDGFWSITVYNADGYLQKNAYDAYSVNNITGKKGSDGAVRVQFGGCDGRVANCLPIMDGWNYTVRLYQPRPMVLNGTWKFPEAQPAVMARQ